MSKIKSLTDNDFNSEITKAETVMVDFGAEWCGPCRMLEPLLEKLSEEIPQPIYRVDVDENADKIVSEYKIMSVPTIIVFKNGQVHKRFSGLTSKENLLKLFE